MTLAAGRVPPGESGGSGGERERPGASTSKGCARGKRVQGHMPPMSAYLPILAHESESCGASRWVAAACECSVRGAARRHRVGGVAGVVLERRGRGCLHHTRLFSIAPTFVGGFMNTTVLFAAGISTAAFHSLSQQMGQGPRVCVHDAGRPDFVDLGPSGAGGEQTCGVGIYAALVQGHLGLPLESLIQRFSFSSR